MASVPFSWTGFYLGVNGGDELARDPGTLRRVATASSETRPVGTVDSKGTSTQVPAGAVGGGGGRIGYSCQTGNLVFGAEADLQAYDRKAFSYLGLCLLSIHSSIIGQRIPCFATVQGRAGYAAGPALFYVTGGWVFVPVETTAAVAAADTLVASATAPGVEIRHALATVRVRVRKETNKGQLPWENVNLPGFVYVDQPGATAAATASIGAPGAAAAPSGAKSNASTDIELAFWRSVHTSGNAEEAADSNFNDNTRCAIERGQAAWRGPKSGYFNRLQYQSLIAGRAFPRSSWRR